MLQSILHDDVQFVQNKKVAKNDKGNEVSVYDVELFGVKMAICLGELIDTFLDKQIYYCPVYLIIKKTEVERIGYFEFYKSELSILLDKHGDLDISLLEGPLLFNYIDADYLINAVSKGQFLKKFSIEEEEFNKLTLEKSKTKKKDPSKSSKFEVQTEESKMGESKNGKTEPENTGVSAAAVASLSTIPETSKDIDIGEKIYDDVSEIPNISIIKTNGEKKINKSLLLESSKQYLEDIKTYKGGNDDNWLQGFYNNSNFTIQDVESNGDCFFATIREAFKTIGMNINVATLRNILSKKLTKENFDINKQIYKETLSALKDYKKEYISNKKAIGDLENKISELLREASLKKDDRKKVVSIGQKRDKLNNKLQELKKEKVRLTKAFQMSKDIYDTKKFMKSIKTFKDYLKMINSSEYWADETAISILEAVFNIKFIIISEEKYNEGNNNVILCGTSILQAIQKRGEFNPKYFILVNHTGNHYKLIKYKDNAMHTFYDLPNIIRENIKKTCRNSLFDYIPLFKQYFIKSK